MNETEDPKADVNLEVVGTGCGTSCGLGCLMFLILAAIGVNAGVAAVKNMQGGIALFSFLAGLVSYVVVGYVTARAARSKRVPVNLHIFVVGGLMIAMGLIGFLIPKPASQLSTQGQATGVLLNIISFLLMIPLMLWGASLHADDLNSSQ